MLTNEANCMSKQKWFSNLWELWHTTKLTSIQFSMGTVAYHKTYVNIVMYGNCGIPQNLCQYNSNILKAIINRIVLLILIHMQFHHVPYFLGAVALFLWNISKDATSIKQYSIYLSLLLKNQTEQCLKSSIMSWIHKS
jgi:hypothetical protein